MTTVAPYGSWTSPITAESLAASGHTVQGGAWVGEDVWWLEARPAEAGRYAVRNSDGDVLPAPWNARTRVHEYGGTAWAVTGEGTLVFSEFTDGRLYRLDAGSAAPVALTPADSGMRFADLAIVGNEVVAVRETHGTADLERDIVAVKIDGTGIRSLVGGSRFLAFPRLSPNGKLLAWIAWEHPQMPWDGTELRVLNLDSGEVTVLLGSTTESVFQPEWTTDTTLTVATDRSGWWNLVSVTLGGEVTAVHHHEFEIGAPLWTLGGSRYQNEDDGRILAIATRGQDSLGILDPHTGVFSPIPVALTHMSLGDSNGTRVLITGASSTLAHGLRILDLHNGSLEDVRLSVDSMPDTGYLSVAEAHTFGGGVDNAGVRIREVHTFVYPPKNIDFVGQEGELPPYIAFVHGGPSGSVFGDFSPAIAYFTSRGLGVIDINYGGSTGYGREYRNRLRGQWGVVDVEDTITAVSSLVEAGLADPARLAIRGGSAGGFTVLAALTSSDVFAAGASYYGVGDMRALAEDTHDFESRYLDGLIGPLPEASELYTERSPLSHVDRLSTPVLLLQGLDDLVVPPAQAESFRDALKAKGLPHAYLAYAGESHGFRRAETIVHATESELSFYGQVMGFGAAGVPVLPLS